MKRVMRHDRMKMHEPKMRARMHEAEGMKMHEAKKYMMDCMRQAMKHLHEAMKYHRKEK